MMNDVPPVSKCTVEQCFYNKSQMCHAPAINVGGSHPSCDTFISEGQHIDRMATGLVGACHVDQCRWNTNLTCHASGIEVGTHAEHADCNTFEQK